jgi:hypothetical protein
MGDSDGDYPTDSRCLPDIGWGRFGGPEDVGLDSKFLICMVVGGGLILGAALALPFGR